MFLDNERGAADHHQHAQDAAGERQHRDLDVVELTWGRVRRRKISAGIVKTTPPASDSPADPIV